MVILQREDGRYYQGAMRWSTTVKAFANRGTLANSIGRRWIFDEQWLAEYAQRNPKPPEPDARSVWTISQAERNVFYERSSAVARWTYECANAWENMVVQAGGVLNVLPATWRVTEVSFVPLTQTERATWESAVAFVLNSRDITDEAKTIIRQTLPNIGIDDLSHIT